MTSQDIRVVTTKYPIDQGWSWVVAIAGNLAHLLGIGCIRSSGVLLASVSETFGSNKKNTSWIMGINMFVFCASITIFMKLSKRIPARIIVFFSGIVISVGFAITSMAPNLYVLYGSMGVLNGIGLGMMHGPTLYLVSNYFEKKRGFGVGIVLAGASMGALVIPPLVTYLLEEYTFRGGTLILSAIQLHICICATLMKSQQTVIVDNSTEIHKTPDLQTDTILLLPEDNNLTMISDNKSIIEKTFRSVQDINISHNKQQPLRKTKSTSHLHKTEDATQSYECDFTEEKISQIAMMGAIGGVAVLPIINDLHKKSHPILNECDEAIHQINNCGPKHRKPMSALSSIQMLKHPMFYLINVPLAITTPPLLLNFMMTPQHALDMKLSSTIVASLLQMQGVADMLIRLIIGYFADLVKIQKINIIIVVNILHGVTYVLMSLFVSYHNAFPGLIAFAVIVGLCGGSTMTLLPVALVQLFGIENLSISFGFLGVMESIFLCGFPPLLGKIKDETGSWRLSFLVVGITTLSFMAVMIIVRLGNYVYNKRYQNYETTQTNAIVT